jgi:hypothetical protein
VSERYDVTADGEGLVSHAGTALLAELADRTGLTGALSRVLASARERRSAHDPGRVLIDVAVMLADGGDCVTDLDAYRGQERPFGARASETTTHRVLKSIDERLLGEIRAARARARSRVWGAGARPETITFNIDATLLTAHSDRSARLGTTSTGTGFIRSAAGLMRPASRWRRSSDPGTRGRTPLRITSQCLGWRSRGFHPRI